VDDALPPSATKVMRIWMEFDFTLAYVIDFGLELRGYIAEISKFLTSGLLWG
jgi:hypothetical protein